MVNIRTHLHIRNVRRQRTEAALVSPGLIILNVLCEVQRNDLLLLRGDRELVVHPILCIWLRAPLKHFYLTGAFSEALRRSSDPTYSGLPSAAIQIR
jgi:hypothetical protein